jgi:hypothetical protein
MSETDCFRSHTAAPRRPLLSRLFVAAALGLTLAAGTVTATEAQPTCAAAYQDFCAMPGWDDPLDERCAVLTEQFPALAAVMPCVPRSDAGTP